MQHCYLAGPMTGYEEYNFPEFFRVGKILQESGWTVYNPAEEDLKRYGDKMPDPFTYAHKKEVMRHDLYIIMNMVQTVFFLPGWRDSKGALLEFSLASFLDIPCFEVNDKKITKSQAISGQLQYVDNFRPHQNGF